MKVTALIPDELINDVKKFTNTETITDSIIIALSEWLSLKKIKILQNELADSPLEFSDALTAGKIREINRKA